MDELDKIYDRLDQAHEDFENGRFAMARRSSERLLRRIRRLFDDETRRPAEVEAMMLLGNALSEQADLHRAGEVFGELEGLLPSGDPDVDSEALFSKARFHLGRWDFAAARETLSRCRPHDKLAARVTDLRGLLMMFDGREEQGRELYREASRIDPRGCPFPAEMSDDEAGDLLQDVVDALPEDIRGALSTVQIDMVFLPDPKIDRSDDLHPEILGVYQGVPLTDRSVFDPVMAPDRIRIFKHNIERYAGDREALRRELRITLLHEIGHHLGWDEDDLAERGLA